MSYNRQPGTHAANLDANAQQPMVGHAAGTADMARGRQGLSGDGMAPEVGHPSSTAGSVGGYSSAGTAGGYPSTGTGGSAGDYPSNTNEGLDACSRSSASTGTAGAGVGEKAKGVFAQGHGIGETLRGNINAAIDSFAGDKKGQVKNEEIARRGQGEFTTGRFDKQGTTDKAINPGRTY